MGLYAKITRYEMVEKKTKHITPKKTYLVKQKLGSYIQPLSNIEDAIMGEFDSLVDTKKGDVLEIELVEMSEFKYKLLPDFAGY